ncbi:unnamed protein product [Closterium sp. NIES-54]
MAFHALRTLFFSSYPFHFVTLPPRYSSSLPLFSNTRTCIHTPGSPPLLPSELSAAAITSLLSGASLAYFDGRLADTTIRICQQHVSSPKTPLVGNLAGQRFSQRRVKMGMLSLDFVRGTSGETWRVVCRERRGGDAGSSPAGHGCAPAKGTVYYSHTGGGRMCHAGPTGGCRRRAASKATLQSSPLGYSFSHLCAAATLAPLLSMPMAPDCLTLPAIFLFVWPRHPILVAEIFSLPSVLFLVTQPLRLKSSAQGTEVAAQLVAATAVLLEAGQVVDTTGAGDAFIGAVLYVGALYLCESKLYLCEWKLYLCESTLYLCESTLYLCESTLYLCESALYLCESRLYLCESTLYPCESTLYLCESTLYLCESSLYLCESTLYLCESALYLCESTLYLCDSTLYLREWALCLCESALCLCESTLCLCESTLYLCESTLYLCESALISVSRRSISVIVSIYLCIIAINGKKIASTNQSRVILVPPLLKLFLQFFSETAVTITITDTINTISTISTIRAIIAIIAPTGSTCGMGCVEDAAGDGAICQSRVPRRQPRWLLLPQGDGHWRQQVANLLPRKPCTATSLINQGASLYPGSLTLPTPHSLTLPCAAPSRAAFHALLPGRRLIRGLSAASAVLITGCSAGGQGVAVSCDWMASRLPSATTVKCAIDAGYFLDEPDLVGHFSFRGMMQRMMVSQWSDASFDPQCVKGETVAESSREV